MTHYMVQPWRERARTAILVAAVAIPVGVVIGGGLDFGGTDDGAVGAGEAVVASGHTTTTEATDSSTSTTSPSTTTTSTTSTTEAPTTTAPAAAVAARAPAQVRVRFYNGSRTAGAAVIVGRRLDALGYAVLQPGPSPADPVPATVIAHRDGFAAEAAAVAQALGVAGVAPSPMPPVPAVAGVGNADVVVIVGDELVATG